MTYRTNEAMYIYCYALESYIRVGFDGTIQYMK